ncbi:MAG: hypothetical protein ACP5HK_02370 [Acidilobus sp.]
MREPATRRPSWDEREKPNEPPCMVRVMGGYSAIVTALSDVKEEIYRYNVIASRRGYYLKPVHKVYKATGGARRVYEYYGRYWWRKGNGRLIYAGTSRPPGLPEPPLNPLEGLSLIREGDDVIVRCDVYEKFKWAFSGLRTERA